MLGLAAPSNAASFVDAAWFPEPRHDDDALMFGLESRYAAKLEAIRSEHVGRGGVRIEEPKRLPEPPPVPAARRRVGGGRRQVEEEVEEEATAAESSLLGRRAREASLSDGVDEASTFEMFARQLDELGRSLSDAQEMRVEMLVPSSSDEGFDDSVSFEDDDDDDDDDDDGDTGDDDGMDEDWEYDEMDELADLGL